MLQCSQLDFFLLVPWAAHMTRNWKSILDISQSLLYLLWDRNVYHLDFNWLKYWSHKVWTRNWSTFQCQFLQSYLNWTGIWQLLATEMFCNKFWNLQWLPDVQNPSQFLLWLCYYIFQQIWVLWRKFLKIQPIRISWDSTNWGILWWKFVLVETTSTNTKFCIVRFFQVSKGIFSRPSGGCIVAPNFCFLS